MSSATKRLDITLIDRGLAQSRTQAKRLIVGGLVTIRIANNDSVCRKPATLVESSSEVFVAQSEEDKYVSRAGLKLEAAFALLDLDLSGRVALDVGQSTGGFSDCLLAHGASRVVGVEVGRDQLKASLRNDDRVTCLEGVNARYLDESHFPPHCPIEYDIVVMDVSFISQTLIIPRLTPFLKPAGLFISLVKPQFEVGKEGVGKHGLVKDTFLFAGVKSKVSACLGGEGFSVLHFIDSPIKGGDGNHEFLIIAKL